MKTLIIPALAAFYLVFSSNLFAQDQQSSTATVVVPIAAPVVTPAPVNVSSTADAFSKMLSTFPQRVLSTINTIVVQSTNATSAGEQKDSLLKKDNLALQLGLLNSYQGGIGVKYWLTELTAFRANIGTSVGGSINRNDYFSIGRNGSSGVNTSDTLNRTGLALRNSSNIQPKVGFNVYLDVSIEKHLFQHRHLSPYIVFGAGLGMQTNSTLYIRYYLS
jgi:hypothetical protein